LTPRRIYAAWIGAGLPSLRQIHAPHLAHPCLEVGILSNKHFGRPSVKTEYLVHAILDIKSPKTNSNIIWKMRLMKPVTVSSLSNDNL
jgi:hypothetical protein